MRLVATEMLQALMSVFPEEDSDSELGTPRDSDYELDDADIVIPTPPPSQAYVIPGETRRKVFSKKARIMRKFYQMLREDSEGSSGECSCMIVIEDLLILPGERTGK
jgi:malate/lactate dehydrogenase